MVAINTTRPHVDKEWRLHSTLPGILSLSVHVSGNLNFKNDKKQKLQQFINLLPVPGCRKKKGKGVAKNRRRRRRRI